MTHEESSELDSSENDENESDFESSESEEESFDVDRVYGFPNDRDGSAFNVAAEEDRRLMMKQTLRGQVSAMKRKITSVIMLFKSHLWMRRTLKFVWQGIM